MTARTNFCHGKLHFLQICYTNNSNIKPNRYKLVYREEAAASIEQEQQAILSLHHSRGRYTANIRTRH